MATKKKTNYSRPLIKIMDDIIAKWIERNVK